MSCLHTDDEFVYMCQLAAFKSNASTSTTHIAPGKRCGIFRYQEGVCLCFAIWGYFDPIVAFPHDEELNIVVYVTSFWQNCIQSFSYFKQNNQKQLTPYLFLAVWRITPVPTCQNSHKTWLFTHHSLDRIRKWPEMTVIPPAVIFSTPAAYIISVAIYLKCGWFESNCYENTGAKIKLITTAGDRGTYKEHAFFCSAQ